MKEGSYVIKPKDLIRWLIHIPIGGVIAYMIMRIDPVMGSVVAFYFFGYEVLEDWRVADRSFKDVFGSLIGMIATGFVLHIWF